MTLPPLSRRAVFLAALALAGSTASARSAPGAASPASAARSRKSRSPQGERSARRREPAAPSYAAHEGASAFAADVADRRGLDRRWIEAQLAQAHRVDAARKLVMPPVAGTAKNWAAYRARFVEPQRIAAGVAFWRDNESWLKEAEERWGVPAEIVVAIVGVETYFGRVTGGFRIIDVLATLAFDFPSGRSDRSQFFRAELEEFFVLCDRERADPLSIKGSYAGAMGLPQFMPSSVNRLAVDMDGDGHIDLHRDPADVVGSVAHYLASFGWERGLPTHFAVAVPVASSDRATLLAPDIVPTFSAAEMEARGAILDDGARAHAGPGGGLLALVELQNGDLAPSYVAGSKNFYVLTRYNWSSYYAMAVIELAAAVKRQK